ncbi:hypothetical protein FI667_g9816, partial [Globisporangium splendens]
MELMEVDTRMGLLIRSLSAYKDVYSVLLQAIQMLVLEFSTKQSTRTVDDHGLEQATTNLSDRCCDPYMLAFVKAGAVADIVDAMDLYLDKPALCLLPYWPLNAPGILNTLLKIARHPIHLERNKCLHQAMSVLSAMPLSQQKLDVKKSALQKIDFVTQVMFAHSKDIELLQKCLLYLDAVLQFTGNGVGTPPSLASLVLNVLAHCNQHSLELKPSFYIVARRVLFRVLDAASREDDDTLFNSAALIVGATIANYRKRHNLDEHDAAFLEKICGMTLTEAVISGLVSLKECHANESTVCERKRLKMKSLAPTDLVCFRERNDESFAARNDVLKLALAVLWSQHAKLFFEKGGFLLCLRYLLDRESERNASIAFSVATAFHYASSTFREQLWIELQAQEGPATLSQAIKVILDTGTDEQLEHFICVLDELVPCEGFIKEFEQQDGLETLANLGGILCDARVEFSTCDIIQLHCMKALVYIYSYRYADDFVFSTQHIKDTLRLMRSKVQDSVLTLEFMNLLAYQLKSKTIRQEYIEYGVLQCVSKAIDVHQLNMVEFNRSVFTIVNSICTEADVRKYICVLESHVNLSTQVSAIDLEPFVESLELCRSVITTLAFTRPHCEALADGRAIELIITILWNAIESPTAKERAPFMRIASSCYSGLTSMVKILRLCSFQHENYADLAISELNVPASLDTGVLFTSLRKCNGCEVLTESLEKAVLIKFDATSTIERGCALIYAILLASPACTSAFVDANWLSTGVSILMHDFGNDTTDRIVEFVLKTIVLVASEQLDCAKLLLKAGAANVLLDKIDREVAHHGHSLNEVRFDLLICVLEILAAVPDTLPDCLVSRSFQTLRTLLHCLSFTSSARLSTILKRVKTVIELLATDDVVRRLASRLQTTLTAIEVGTRAPSFNHAVQGNRIVKGFIALEAILLSSRGEEILKGVAFHRIFMRIAALDDAMTTGAPIACLGLDASFFQELMCLSSQLLNSSYRDSIFTSTLHFFLFSESNLDSLIWMRTLDCDHSAHESECALEGIEGIVRVDKQRGSRQLVELGVVPLLLECLVHHNGNEVVAGCTMRLLLGLFSSPDHVHDVLKQVVANHGHIVIPVVCRGHVNDERISMLVIQTLMRMIDVQDSSVEMDAIAGSSHEVRTAGDETTSEGELRTWRAQVLHELLHTDILSLLFHLLGNHCQTSDMTTSTNASFVGMLLELLYDLTRLDAGRDRAEELHVLQHLQQVVHVVWSQGDNKNPLLLESAIDCFVNLACANRPLHGWHDIPLWLLSVADSIQSQVKYKLPLCLEKILGVLTCLVVHPELGHQLACDGAHLILQLLVYSDDEIDYRHVEQGIYALMMQLCVIDRSSIPVFMLFDVIVITAERISVHLEDENYLCACLEFLDLVTNKKPALLSLEDRQEVILALEGIVAKHETTSSKQVYRASRALLTNLGVTDPDSRKLVSSATNLPIAKSFSSLPIQTAQLLSKQEPRYRDLLLEGALFRVFGTTIDAKKQTKKKQSSARNKVRVTLAVDGTYLLFHHLSSHPPRVERVFVSQLSIVPSSTADKSERKTPVKRALSSYLTRSPSSTEKELRYLQLLVRGEAISMEASSAEERISWEKALQWLVTRQSAGVPLT